MEFQQEFIVIADRLQIRYYGLIIVAAMLIGAWVAARLAKRSGLNPEHVWGGLTWAIIPGIIFARLWFVLFPPATLTAGCADPSLGVCHDIPWFIQNFFNLQDGAIAIWSGGLSIFGAVLGGALGAYLYLSKYHNPMGRAFNAVLRFWRFYVIALGVLLILAGGGSSDSTPIAIGIVIIILAGISFLPPVRRWLNRMAESETEQFPENGMAVGPWLDIAAVALPLGQAIGRWANFINQELYGTVTTLPWGITIDSRHRVAPYTSTVDYPFSTTLFHPLFLYESLWNVLAFVVLLNLYQRYRSRFLPGDLFLIYIAQYSFVRFLLEFLRVEVAYLPGTTINSSQVASLIAFAFAVLFFLYRHRPGAVQNTTSGQTPAENTSA